jgi:cytochrome c nitrite reductase small subunit
MVPRSSMLVWLLAMTMGLSVGIALYTFVYARGASYLTDDPKACLNCHVMRAEYDGWIKASHRQAAVCNDCHTPEGVMQKYASKGYNGFLHSVAFTSGHFPNIIQLKPYTRSITERACLKCHAEIVQAIQVQRGQDLSCLHCHQNVGHQ